MGSCTEMDPRMHRSRPLNNLPAYDAQVDCMKWGTWTLMMTSTGSGQKELSLKHYDLFVVMFVLATVRAEDVECFLPALVLSSVIKWDRWTWNF